MEEEREASIASSSDFYGSEKESNTPALTFSNAVHASKRKADVFDSPQGKKRRVETPPPTTPELAPCAGLPPAVWQHIFLFCPLKTLGRLLQVNRLFHSYLTDVRNIPHTKPESGFLRLLKSESIWASARNLHPTKPPKPLPGFSELQMWQLAFPKHCQFCGKTSSFTPGEKIWQRGPGSTGVRIVWPFGIRTCASCLLDRCKTDASLLFSEVSAVRPALPFAFVTSDSNYIPAYTLQAATTPGNVEIVKYFYKPHVDEISQELMDALSLGPAAAEEWYKGLQSRGKERMKVAENWERWEVKYQWWQSHHEPKREPSAAPSIAPSTASTLSQSKPSPGQQAPSSVIHAPVPASKYPSVHSVALENAARSSSAHTLAPSNLTAVATASPHVHPRSTTNPPPVSTPQPLPTVGQPSRGERNLHDANEAKAIRKLEIERRSQLLDPPIPPNVLRHMESFKAAIQISQPMTDYAWSVLQPRLLAQLPAAQQAESDHASRIASLPTRTSDRRQQDANLKEVKEVLDREWEESQGPIRDRLGAIADDFINNDWDHGRAVTYDNCPKFAVDLLMYVRRKFYAEVGDDAPSDAKSADTTRSTKPRLVLDNMKWVYDYKLKPLTENFRKELFLCYGSGCEGNPRYYGFEGIIQHFGAKHTNTFSVGNVVVAWRDAEWPEDPPFHPDPISVQHGHSNHSGYGTYYGGYTRPGTSTPHVLSNHPQPSPSHFGYPGHYNGPFAPPLPGPHAALGYDQPMGPPGQGAFANGQGYMTSPALSHAASLAYPTPTSGPIESSAQGTAGSDEYRTNLYDKQVSTIIEASQDIWKRTSGIKDFPNSLRIYVLLHRVISKFHIEFNHEPHLNHFIDALSNHEIPRALKHAPGLSCKACQHRQSSYDHSVPSEERRTFTVLKLLSHFQYEHTRPQHSGYGYGQAAPPLDWKEDMIELPSDRFISGLVHAPGMDDDKLRMIATVFPSLFPPPLPRIGVRSNEVSSPAHAAPPISKDATRIGGTPGVPIERSAPSSRASPYRDSPRPPKPSAEEYDPQHPALITQPAVSARANLKSKDAHEDTTPADRRHRVYEEPRYYLPRAPMEDDYAARRDYAAYVRDTRAVRDAYSEYDDHPEGMPLYREYEMPPGPDRGDAIYPRLHDYERRTFPARGYYREEERQYRFVPGGESPEPARRPPGADTTPGDFAPGQHMTKSGAVPEPAGLASSNPLVHHPEQDDGSRYSPPPGNALKPIDPKDQSQPAVPPIHKAPSTVSNGSRYEEGWSKGRQVPTPDSGAPRRAGYYRRRDRHHDYAHSRFPRHIRVGREDAYARGANMGRSQSRRYERYEEQRRRLDQQETPQPKIEREPEPEFSRDTSVDNGYPEDPYQTAVRVSPREYVPIQDRVPPYSSPRYRYAGSPEGPRLPPQVFLDEYGHPVEIIRVPRDPRGGHPPYPPARYYTEHDEPIQYVSYDRPRPLHEGRPAEYVYYEEREEPPLSARRRVFEPASEVPPPPPPPPEVKMENPPVPLPPEGV